MYSKNFLRLNLNCSFLEKYIRPRKGLIKYVHNAWSENLAVEKNENNVLDKLIKKYEGRILYNSVIESKKLKLGYRRNRAIEEKQKKEYQKQLTLLATTQPLPISLKYLNKNNKTEIFNTEKQSDTVSGQSYDTQIAQFPFENVDKVTSSAETIEEKTEFMSAEKEVLVRKSQMIQNSRTGNSNLNWMTDYENYDDKQLTSYIGEQMPVDDDITWKLNYGTPDPNCAVSDVPCGGCGALLHCKDTSIPGYIPSEIFKSHKKYGGQHLRTLICQRCHFLKNFDMALQVRVSPEDYPTILEAITRNKNALVILMVDLLDFPCSVWPNIINIIGSNRPVFVVGNKVDLLPKDSRGYLDRIKKILADSIHSTSLTQANIQYVSLISAKTGYGVEELITKLHNFWKYQGDVYLVGCTNVGKSTLFNALLQSDYCKIKAVDLIQRATTSLWPGTTLNLLKFPILRPSGWRLYVRTKRLMSLNKISSQENRLRKIQLRQTQNPKYATLMGHIERTFSAEEPVNENSDLFSIQGHENASGKVRIGISENDPAYKFSRWCYDTPGVVQPDQILHLLTTEELMLTLPRKLISPRTYTFKAGSTIFLAGLARLDYLEGPESIRFTVFASERLPVTICATNTAEDLYRELLGTELLQVPAGNKDRLNKWPDLTSSEEIKLTGVDWEMSCADVVLSSAGWISVSLGTDLSCTLRAWTPDKRGIYIRNSLLNRAVALRGRRIRFSPAYKKSKFFID